MALISTRQARQMEEEVIASLALRDLQPKNIAMLRLAEEGVPVIMILQSKPAQRLFAKTANSKPRLSSMAAVLAKLGVLRVASFKLTTSLIYQ